MRKFLLAFSVALFFILQQGGSLSTYEELSIALFAFFFLDFLYNLGNKIVILDLIILEAFLTCLFMPVIFYHVYTRQNPLAYLWVKYMPITSDDYFSFALPAVLALVAGLKIPLSRKNINKNPALYMENMKAYLVRHPQMGLYLVGIGVVAGMLDFLSSAGLREIFFLMAHLVFVGVFYVIYSPNKRKRLIVPGVIALMLGEAVLTGMFGELVFILACSLILVLLGKKVAFGKKLGFAIVGILLIIIIQSVKGEYRKQAWSHGADAFFFGQLIADRVSDPSILLDPKELFVMSVRLNQGWLVAVTMKKVPAVYPFGDGEPLLESVAAAFIPRFIWPDKPEAGGKANLKRFWGFNLVGWSTNIGTLGEAYANFDRTGGWVYMFFYGLFFNVMLSWVLKLAERRPTLVLWLPFLFFSVVNVETDLLTTMGALIKSLIFMWVIFRLFRYQFKMDL